jgi:hypothetical protein
MQVSLAKDGQQDVQKKMGSGPSFFRVDIRSCSFFILLNILQQAFVTDRRKGEFHVVILCYLFLPGDSHPSFVPTAFTPYRLISSSPLPSSRPRYCSPLQASQAKAATPRLCQVNYKDL